MTRLCRMTHVIIAAWQDKAGCLIDKRRKIQVSG